MKTTITIILTMFALSLSAQRQYTPGLITTIDGTASEGDLYTDTVSNIVYIGLMDGSLIPINNTDDQAIQTFSYDAISKVVTLLLEDGGGTQTINLDTLAQDLSDGGRLGVNQTIDISGGSSVTFSVADNDNSSTNEIQDLDLSGNDLTITNNGSATTIDLLPYLDNSDSQNLSDGGRTGVTQTVDISGGSSMSFSVADNDNSSTNEIQDLDLSGNDLTITNNGSATTIDLLPYLDNSDSQNLSDGGRTGVTQTVDISGGSSMSFSVADNDNSSTNEIQDLDLSGNDLTITNNGSATTIDLLPYLDNSDSQNLSDGGRTGVTQTVDISGGSSMSFSVADNDNSSTNEIQTLTYTNTNVNDNFNTLQISGSLAFNIDDNHLGTDNQTLTGPRTILMDGNDLTFDGTQDVIIESDGEVGIGTTNPAARLDVDNGSVRFSDYGIGTYAETQPTIDSATYVMGVNGQGDLVEMNTVKSSKIFYPPAIVIDVSTLSADFSEPGTGDETLNLYSEYASRYGLPAARSTSAPSAIPTYANNELHYYVTDYDTSVFANVAITDAGVMTYDIKSVPANNCTFINVVFVVK